MWNDIEDRDGSNGVEISKTGGGLERIRMADGVGFLLVVFGGDTAVITQKWDDRVVGHGGEHRKGKELCRLWLLSGGGEVAGGRWSATGTVAGGCRVEVRGVWEKWHK